MYKMVNIDKAIDCNVLKINGIITNMCHDATNENYYSDFFNHTSDLIYSTLDNELNECSSTIINILNIFNDNIDDDILQSKIKKIYDPTDLQNYIKPSIVNRSLQYILMYLYDYN